jgi:hypothetical protein
MTRTLTILLIYAGLTFMAGSHDPQQDTLTAFEAKSLALSLASPEARNNVVQLYSVHVSSAVFPDEWRVTFWNPAKAKAEVFLINRSNSLDVSDDYEGNFMDQPSMNEYSTRNVIDPLYFQIDSDKALEIASSCEEVAKEPISRVDYSLKRDSETMEPFWTLTFYTKVKGVNLEYIKVNLSADSGEVLQVYPPQLKTTEDYE